MKKVLLTEQEQELVLTALKVYLKNCKNNAEIYNSIKCKQEVILIESIIKDITRGLQK